MNRLKNSIAIIACVFLLSFTSATMASSVRDFMDDMFMTASTSPQVVNTQRRGGIVGGSFHARTPIRNINLISYSQPSLDVGGCGGISLNAGSFTLLSLDEAIRTMRQIGQNALSFAFSLALSGISEMIASKISEYRERIDAFNRMFRNTCQMGKLLVPNVDGEGGLEFAAAQEWGQKMGSILAKDGDREDQADVDQAERLNPGITQINTPATVNHTWEALQEKTAEGVLDFTPYLGVGGQRANEIVMSLIGTVIYCRRDEEDEGPARLGDWDGWNGPTIEFADFRDGLAGFREVDDGDSSLIEQKPLRVYQCQDSEGCCQMGHQEVEFEGFEEIVWDYLERIEDAIVTGDDAALESDELVRFINTTTLPVVRVLSRYSGNPSVRNFLKTVMGEVIAEEFLFQFGEVLLHQTRFIFSGTEYVPSAAMDVVRQDIRQTLQDIKPHAGETMSKYLMLLDLMEKLDQFQFRQNQPGRWGRSGAVE